tara:strand:- start:1142 stop:1423 length:282 start_codon:yes stop_codon:yes gene_type:complete
MDAPAEMKFMTPDTVAECMPGITKETYSELWGVLDKLPKVTQEQIEDGMHPSEYNEIRCTAQVWEHLSEAAQQNIVESIKTERQEEHWRRAAE